MSDMAYFPMPVNDNFTGYWDRARDRIYKIRHSLDIEGVARHLSLFQPEIDPRSIISALAGGDSLADIANDPGKVQPHLRFSTALSMAKEVTNNVIALGHSLLMALEKKDSAHLSMVQSTQQRAVLDLMGKMKAKQSAESSAHLEALNASLDAAKERHSYYGTLLIEGFLPEENVNMLLSAGAVLLHGAALVTNAVAIPAYLIPNIFGMSNGGQEPGPSLQAAAATSENAASGALQAGQLAMIMAENRRRRGEWTLQQSLATSDIAQLGAEIKAAQFRSDALDLENNLHTTHQEQNEEFALLLQDRFTNKDLYGWMVRQISGVYFQSYKMAFDLVRQAESAYRFERNVKGSPIVHPTWNSLHKGLLAGETLMLGINHLEKAWVDAGENRAQISKTISMKVPKQDISKRFDNGKFRFDITEHDLNMDFPGHYCRKIDSIAVTIPSITGPYTDIHATLRQETNRLIPEPDISAVQTLSDSGASFEGGVISGKIAQQVILSHPVRDSGVFEPLGMGPQYRPFEGTGAVSSWTLELNPLRDKKVLDSITDVIVHLRYSAKIGDSTFQNAVRDYSVQNKGIVSN